MKASVVLRLCVALELVLAVVAIASSYALDSFLPEPLRAWQAAASETVTFGDFILFAFIVPLIVCLLVASVGLLLLKRWAAWLYLGVSVAGVLITPFTGITVEHPLTDTAEEIGSVLNGLVLGLAFFSDALKPRMTLQAPARPAPGGPT